MTSGFYGAVWLTLLDPSLYGAAAAKYFPLLAESSWVRAHPNLPLLLPLFLPLT